MIQRATYLPPNIDCGAMNIHPEQERNSRNHTLFPYGGFQLDSHTLPVSHPPNSIRDSTPPNPENSIKLTVISSYTLFSCMNARSGVL